MKVLSLVLVFSLAIPVLTIGQSSGGFIQKIKEARQNQAYLEQIGKTEAVFLKVEGLSQTPFYLISNKQKTIVYMLSRSGNKTVETNVLTGQKKEFRMGSNRQFEDYVFEKQQQVKVMEAPRGNVYDKYCSNVGLNSVSASCQSAFCDYLECILEDNCNAGSRFEQLQTLKAMCGAVVAVNPQQEEPPLKRGN